MPKLELKANHRVIGDFYKEIKDLAESGNTKEGSVSPAFGRILLHCAKLLKLKFVEQHSIKRKGRNPLRTDGTVISTHA